RQLLLFIRKTGIGIRVRKRLVIAISTAVQTQHVSGGLLELQLVEESVRHIHALASQTLDVTLTVGDFGHPECKPTGVRHAAEKVKVGLPHEKVGFFGWVPLQL